MVDWSESLVNFQVIDIRIKKVVGFSYALEITTFTASCSVILPQRVLTYFF